MSHTELNTTDCCFSSPTRPAHGVDQWVSAAFLLEQFQPIGEGRWQAIVRQPLHGDPQEGSWTLTAIGSRPRLASFLLTALVKIERFAVIDTASGATDGMTYSVVTGKNDRTVVADVIMDAAPLVLEDDPLPVGLDLSIDVSEGAGLVRWAVTLPVWEVFEEDLAEAAVDVLPPGVEDWRTATQSQAVKVGDNTIFRSADGDIRVDVTSANSVVRTHWNLKDRYVGSLDGAPKVGYGYVYLQRYSGANPVDCVVYGTNVR